MITRPEGAPPSCSSRVGNLALLRSDLLPRAYSALVRLQRRRGDHVRGISKPRFSRVKVFDVVIQRLDSMLTNEKLAQRGAPLRLTQRNPQVPALLAATRGQQLWVQATVWHPRSRSEFLPVHILLDTGTRGGG